MTIALGILARFPGSMFLVSWPSIMLNARAVDRPNVVLIIADAPLSDEAISRGYLCDMRAEPAEAVDLWNTDPDVVREPAALLKTHQQSGRSARMR